MSVLLKKNPFILTCFFIGYKINFIDFRLNDKASEIICCGQDICCDNITRSVHDMPIHQSDESSTSSSVIIAAVYLSFVTFMFLVDLLSHFFNQKTKECVKACTSLTSRYEQIIDVQ